MSGVAMKWAKRQKIEDAILISVLKRLAEIADDRGASRASQATLATACGMSERSVRRALRLLSAFGLLIRSPRSLGRLGRTSDLIVLTLHRNVTVPRSTIRKARAATRAKLQPDNASVPTGHSVRGIMKGTTSPPSQEGEAASYVEGCRKTPLVQTPAAGLSTSAVVLPFPRRGAA